MSKPKTAHNDITGDKIATKPSKAYEANYDAIFRKPRLDPEYAEFLKDRGVLEELYPEEIDCDHK